MTATVDSSADATAAGSADPTGAASADATAAGRMAADNALGDLTRGQRRWARMDLAARADLLRHTHAAVAGQAQAWVEAACRYKQLDPTSPLVGEEWLSGPYAVLTNLAALERSVRAVSRGRSPVEKVPTATRPGGRVALRVLPGNVFDQLLLSGIQVEVWMQPGRSGPAVVRAQAGLAQRRPEVPGGLCVVLGAGNITSIPPLDVLYQLIAYNRGVLLKLNPLAEVMMPVLVKALAPLIDAGVLRIVTGGVELGEHLVHHEQVTHVHLTGSAATHDAIVFGGSTGAGGHREPLLTKEITSELGGVAPIIVVPGRWSAADLRFQAEHVATMRLHNGGYNCIAGQVLVVAAGWAQKDQFLVEVRAALQRAPRRVDYYPGSAGRVESAVAAYPNAVSLDGRVLLTDIPPRPGESAFDTEYFAPVLAVTELPGAGLTFLRAAVSLANDDLVGTLGANVLIHPRTRKAMGAAFLESVTALRYGTIAINSWTGVGFLTPAAPWGAFPGHRIDDVQSGIGVVHNAFLLADPERCVVEQSFRPFPRAWWHGEFTLLPRPPWFVNNRSGATTSRLMTEFAARPRWRALPGIFRSALRG